MHVGETHNMWHHFSFEVTILLYIFFTTVFHDIWKTILPKWQGLKSVLKLLPINKHTGIIAT